MDYLLRAFQLAKKAHPSPNPRVGCVLVKGDKILGSGYHRKAGEDHAEVAAIRSVQNKGELKGAILFTSLEPCSHEEKRTPPCTPAIIEAGIKKVVIGCEDENPRVQGMEELRKAGVEVELVNDPGCRELNEGFFHWVKTRRPFVLVKLAMTLDGRIATKTGDSQYISNPQSRSLGYAWRALYDAILVGINTVLIDNPRLTARTPRAPNPIRIVVDGRLRIPLTSLVLEPNARRIIATTEKHDTTKKKRLEEMGVEVWVLPEEKPDLEVPGTSMSLRSRERRNVLEDARDVEKPITLLEHARERLSCSRHRSSITTSNRQSHDHVDLHSLMKRLGEQGIVSVIVEGGSEIATDFLEQRLISKGAFFVAAKILGAGKNAFEGKGVEKMDQAWQLKNISIRKVGNDVLVTGYF